ncbi:MAG: hypothetical protein J6C27_00930 [Clostridia bacterium]|nr:hypothetical protein [Clostridia bacterium]
MAELYRRKCKCGRKFYSESKLARLCPLCKGESKKERWQQNNENCKKPIVEVPKPVPVNIPLPKMMQLLELYNKNHGTKYSYGQFVSGLHTGKIKIGVVKNE